MNESTVDLLRSLKLTAGARFAAAKRVSHLDSRLTAVTAFTSVYIVVMTILPYLVEVNPTSNGWTNLFTIGLSIFLLVVSLLHYSCQFSAKSELFHRSALEIQELKRELQFLGRDIAKEEFQDISRRYNDVMKKFSLNHDDVDFWRYQLEYSKDFQMGFFEKQIKLIKVKISYNYPVIILTVLTIFAICVVLLSIFEQRYIDSIFS